MQLASQEAFRLNHEYIGTEHILLGLLNDKEWSGVTPGMKSKVAHDFFKVRTELYKYVKSGSSIVMVGKLPYTPEAKNVMRYADEEARNSGHPCVEAEHILLGLLREPEGIAGRVLTGFGLDVEELRTEIQLILRQPDRIAEGTRATATSTWPLKFPE
jgi:ATP-dependent Clp protease ATP-binding subunit ClpC